MQISYDPKNGIEVVVLTPDDRQSWALFPYALDRIAAFCRKYDSDADAALMCAHLQQMFVLPVSQAYIIVVLREGVIVTHMLLLFEEYFGTKMATILQYECDEALPRSVVNASFGFVERWARNRGAKYLQAMTRNDTLARAFRIYQGFEPTRVLLRKPLGETLSTGVVEDAQGQLKSSPQASSAVPKEN